MTDFELLSIAKESRNLSYSPYSGISVGAALLCEGERVYVGANIENVAHSPTVCAERVAFFKAISEGEGRFLKIAVAGGKNGSDTVPLFSPCGVCRQVMEEFCSPDFEIILEKDTGVQRLTLAQLLPYSFGKEKL